MNIVCGTCRCFVKDSVLKGGQGECHRYPPQVVPAPKQTSFGIAVKMISVFPTVMESTVGCMEYQQGRSEFYGTGMQNNSDVE